MNSINSILLNPKAYSGFSQASTATENLYDVSKGSVWAKLLTPALFNDSNLKGRQK
jgi:hypothetical protein